MKPAARYIVFAALLGAVAAHARSEDAAGTLAQGEYLLTIGGCVHCHTVDGGTRLAGGRTLETPFGTFYSPNLTPHPDNGLGAWSEADLDRALRHGIAPGGSHYYPAFPYTSYTRMRSEDISALYAYLMSLQPVDAPNREHELVWYLRWRFAAQVWKWLFFDPAEFHAPTGSDSNIPRGAYIAEALAHCQECHTPRNLLGALRSDMAYAGNPEGPDDELVPNITPDANTGIGDWSRDELISFLRSGVLPDGEYTLGSMDYIIQGTNKLTDADRAALADYLRSLPPIENRVSN